MTFTIRKADIHDCELIHEMASKTWENTYGTILSPEQLAYMFDMMYSIKNLHHQMCELHHQFFIIYADGQPGGYLSIETLNDDLYEFQKVYSLPQLHGTGIGRYIIKQGVAYLKSIHRKPFAVELHVNRYNPAVNFYKHMGFYQSDQGDFPIGNGYFMNDYIMRMEVK
ncbi:MAG: GNAT family N-acetyltransferase [Parabacteroides sp.]|nr:GNAT family N-acetyltransferase [Parabacteroides sp.]